MTAFTNLFVGFIVNLLVAVFIVRYIYYPVKQNKNYVFTFIAFNTAIYFVMSVLTSVELSVGVGFSLFGLFSLLRYRTNPMPTREMTYLFVIIALPVLNSVLITDDAWLSLGLVDAAIVAILYVLERGWGFHYELSQRLVYERIDLIKPDHYDLLLADLRERTGLPIKRFEVSNINFLRDTAEIKIYYDDPQKSGGSFAWLDSDTGGYWDNGRTLSASAD
ncbi:MAG: DUF4956 domain-containing protein [Chloroflexota bacterium]|nr:DUF4956 domain-containing protein [Anaerolineales bacterium]MCB8965817.1 DUF4956 domain-containing protein [Ardenticatenaceae bacterium]